MDGKKPNLIAPNAGDKTNKTMRQINTILFSLVTFLLLSCGGEDRYGTTPVGDPSQDGINSSYTAVVAVEDRLYYVDSDELFTADITNPDAITVMDKQRVGENLETVFFTNGLLFIGSGPALYIYALDSLGMPSKYSETSYSNFDGEVYPCDPVVADDDYAYVTLSSVQTAAVQITWFFSLPILACTREVEINQLMIYDISDLQQPILESTLDLNNPKGLAIEDDILFVCDGDAGLKVIDVSDRRQPVIIEEMTDIHTYDVIAKDSLLVVTGPSEIAQYDYSDLSDIELLSIYGF